MKTTQKVLEELYDAQVEAMRLALANPRELGAATLNVIRQFLKDAGVEAKPTAGSALGALVNSLPTFDGDAAELPTPLLKN